MGMTTMRKRRTSTLTMALWMPLKDRETIKAWTVRATDTTARAREAVAPARMAR